MNSSCYMNSNFGGAVIYADDIKLMGPTRSSIMSLLNECDAYARKHDIMFNPVKTNCTFSPSSVNSVPS